MPLPLADFDKQPVVFLDTLAPFVADLYRAFNVRFVLTSNVMAGRTHSEAVALLVQLCMPVVANNLSDEWATSCDDNPDSNLEDEVDAWHATARDRTPTSYLIITTPERIQHMGHILREYAVAVGGPDFNDDTYIDACRVLHSQLSFKPFSPDWY